MFLNYPYTDLYNLNLDWIIKAIKEVQDVIGELGSVVNSVNGQTGDVTIDKAFITNLLGNYLESFNGRSGEVDLQASDVNNLSIEILYVSDAGDVISDYTQDDLDAFWAAGKRIMILVNNLGVPDQMYVLTLVGDVVTPQPYTPTSAQSGVSSINGISGAVTLTGADMDVSGEDSTTVAAKLATVGSDIAAETTARQGADTALTGAINAESTARQAADTALAGDITAEATARAAADTALTGDISSLSSQIVNLGNAIAYVENGDNATQKTYTDGEYLYWKGALYTVNSGGIPLDTAIANHVTAVPEGGINALANAMKLQKDTSLSGVTLWKQGHVVVINISKNNIQTSDAWQTILTVPTGYRPSQEISGWYSMECEARFVITANGELQANKAVSGNNLRLTGCYMVD